MQRLDILFEMSHSVVNAMEQLQARPLLAKIDWSDRLIGIIGQKGVGKTTLLLQRMESLPKAEMAIYISLDNPIAQSSSLLEIAQQFFKEDGAVMFLDEVHKYPDWSSHIKSIYDLIPKLKIVFSGSSALHIHKGKGDLSRRLSLYHLPTLSFREFIQLQMNQSFDTIDLIELCENHIEISKKLLKKAIKPIGMLKKHLRYGAYPFFREGIARFGEKLQQAINQTMESDLVFVNNLDPRYIPKLKKLFYLISTTVPFSPNMSALSQSLEMSRATVGQYLEYLQDAGLVALLRAKGRGYQILSKPEKVYLENTNLLYAIGQDRVNAGNLRETFFYNQLRGGGILAEFPPSGDFVVKGKLLFEVGGQNKNRSQVRGEREAYIVSDDIEVGSKGRIPLWLFGFLY